MKNQIYKKLSVSLELTLKKKHFEIQNLLKVDLETTMNSKGIFAEYFIAELVIGNGSWAITTSAKDDDGIDIIQYTRTNYTPCKCLQIKNQEKPLTLNEVICEIEKFGKSFYNYLPYEIISLSGYTFDKSDLSNQNVQLLDYDYIIELIDNYSKYLNPSPGSTYFLRDEYFLSQFDVMIKYRHKFGEFYLDKLPEDVKTWCTNIRMKKSKGKLNIKKVLLMDSIKFYWNFNTYIWDQSFYKIKVIYDMYGETYGFVNEPSSKLWIKKQIIEYRNCNLSPYRENKLKSINLINDWILNI